MSRLDLASLREGDVIERRQTLQVTRVSGEYVEAKDVQSYKHYGFTPADVNGSQSTLKLEMVKRAVRKPKVGDVLTGCELKAIQWKRGTVFQGVESGRLHMLDQYGRLACSHGGNVELDFLSRTNTYKIIHLP